jgi:high frequency lysogenization protein
MKERTLALAGVLQATELVRQAAQHGTWSGFAASTCLKSLLAIESGSVNDVYGGVTNLRVGVETLVSVLQGEQRHVDALRYSIGLLQIERRFHKSRLMQNQVGQELERIYGLGTLMPEHERQDLQAEEIAKLYSHTISKLTPRIVVNGNPVYLQTNRTVSWIRTLLFSGLRSAVLWRQLGGGRFNLFFGRKRILSEARKLL